MHKFLCIYNDGDEFKLAIVFAEDEEKARIQFVLSTDLIDDCLIDKSDVVNYVEKLKDATYCDDERLADDETPRYCGTYVYIYNLDDVNYSKVLTYENSLVNLKDVIKNKLNINC